MSRTTQGAGLQWGPCPELMPKGCEIAVLHGDPAKPNADVFFRVPGKAEIPSQWIASQRNPACRQRPLQAHADLGLLRCPGRPLPAGSPGV